MSDLSKAEQSDNERMEALVRAKSEPTVCTPEQEERVRGIVAQRRPLSARPLPILNTEQSNSERIAALEVRLAAAEARLAAVEARPLAFTIQTVEGVPASVQGSSTCPYCYLPWSMCKGHNICESPGGSSA